LHGRR
jgi:hypothetical protein